MDDPMSGDVAASTPVSSPSRPPTVPVEVFGVPRLLLGTARAEAAGSTLGALAADLAARCPALSGRVLDPETGWLLSGYVFVVDGRFTRDRALPIAPASEVLLVSSVAGGAA
jgi:molybdopterin converting factor small subunit